MPSARAVTTSSYSVSPGWRVILEDMGVSVTHLLHRAGAPSDLFSRTSRLSPELYNALWSALEAEVQVERPLPILVAEAISTEALDPPLLAAMCCQNLHHAAERLAEYKPLIGPIRLEVEARSEGLRLVKRWPADAAPTPVLGHTELLFWVAITRLATRRAVSPTQVTAPMVPSVPAPFREYLGVDVERARDWSLSFSWEDATRPFLTANQEKWRFFEPGLQDQLSELTDGVGFSDRVQVALMELLPSGNDTVEAVARKLAVSKRTLQRRLREEDTTFQRQLRTTREGLARYYLQQSELSAPEVSFLLGYADPNSFYRAFKSWTGQTPESVRAAVQA